MQELIAGRTSRAQDLSAFQKRSGLVFRDPALLDLALTHRSFAAERGGGDNQRLEFLGDALIEGAVSAELFCSRTNDDEGKLTRRRARLVCQKSLARCADKLGLGELLRRGRGQTEATEAMKADAFEALAAALYLDGGAEAMRGLVDLILSEPLAPLDAKTLLCQWGASCRVTVTFEETGRTGPDHEPHFFVRVQAGSETACGEGPSRLAAEQDAAGKVIRSLEERGECAIGCPTEAELL
ncbi:MULTISPECIES: ribonuclease III family protein [Jonquetella]|uniref:Ribonuclease 3 n=1 Tax=Jonquetella anthropi DSM 22815 TaxID=885272 RepID=H0UJJ3_9BACT|nr:MULTISPECIES: ribonuclease III domain-containing protein [Jonquetella]EEX48844.1 ribonuclease III [Jonquetella anthropi E3_33 E1]EHM12861.1 dsRNA-specific ribonuclease [Jonquetella anthropi DSM 22815]ERL24011.1 ribonuclease III domain protein [Jonquetella sp. BV3C21]